MKEVRLGGHGVSFVIRLWLENKGQETPPEWRWCVLHVQSGLERYGRRWEDLSAFVAEQAGVEMPMFQME